MAPSPRMVGQRAPTASGPPGQMSSSAASISGRLWGRPKTSVTTARRVPSSQRRRLAPLGCIKRGGRRGGRPSPQLSSGRGGRVGLPRRGAAPLIEVEVARRLLLEPEPVVLRRLLEEVRRVLEEVGVVG